MFKKKRKKRMLDVRELQKRGVVKIPRKEMMIPTDSKGFVELKNNSALETTSKSENSNEQFFGYGKTASQSTSNFSTESDGYNKREVDQKIIDLDNKIYKLEQRIELLEKKTGVNQPGTPGSLIGW